MKNSQSKADDILQCARTLIIRGGYNSFSYADISHVVGIRNASIHHHFPSKSNLVQKLVAQYRLEAEAGIAELERNISDPLEQLRAYIDYWQGCVADATHPFCVCALLASEIPILPETVVTEIRAHFRGLSDWLTAVLQRGVTQGRLVLTGTARANAEIFMATVHGAMLSARAHGDPATFGAITRPMLERITA